MMRYQRVFLCEGFVDRDVIGRICKKLRPGVDIEVRMPREVDGSASGRTACAEIVQHLVQNNAFVYAIEARSVSIAVYMDRDVNWLFDAGNSHNRVAVSRGYNIETDVFMSMDLQSAITRTCGIQGLVPSHCSAADWCGECYNTIREFCFERFVVQMLSIRSVKGFGHLCNPAQWPPVDVQPRFQSEIHAQIAARGLSPHDQIEILRDWHSQLGQAHGFAALVNGKCFESAFVAYVCDLARSYGRTVQKPFVQSVCMLSVVESCDFQLPEFYSIRQAVTLL